MRACLECIPCFIRQAMDACKMVLDDKQIQQKVMKKVLLATAEFDMNLTPPEMAQKIHRIIREETGCEDPYFDIKQKSTDRAIEIRDKVQFRVNSFEKAVRFSIAGNIMDFGVKSTWNEDLIMESFNKAENIAIDRDMIGKLYEEIAPAKTVLVLADNAGESVFDKMLIENFPGSAEVIYAVKGSPIINDVTQYDAERADIGSVATIISNGVDIPGTSLEQSSSEFVDCFNRADVIIAKGQGNFETLNTCKRKVYFLFQVKCSVIADYYDYGLGDWMVTNSDITR